MTEVQNFFHGDQAWSCGVHKTIHKIVFKQNKSEILDEKKKKNILDICPLEHFKDFIINPNWN